MEVQRAVTVSDYLLECGVRAGMGSSMIGSGSRIAFAMAGVIEAVCLDKERDALGNGSEERCRCRWTMARRRSVSSGGEDARIGSLRVILVSPVWATIVMCLLPLYAGTASEASFL
jgi:hypothetical protein